MDPYKTLVMLGFGQMFTFTLHNGLNYKINISR